MAEPGSPAAGQAPDAVVAEAVAGAGDAILGRGRDGRISYWNRAAEQLYGWPARDVLGQPGSILFTPEQHQKEGDILSRVLAGAQAEPYRTRRLRSDGGTVDVEVRMSPIIGPDGRITGVSDVARAVPPSPVGQAEADAHRVRLERELSRTQRLESLAQLAGGVAHDFNNLLAVILNHATLMEDDLAAVSQACPDPRLAGIRADVRQIRHAGERAINLTRQLVTFARREVVRPELVNLNVLVDGVVPLLRHTLGTDIRLAWGLPDDLWPVLADPARLEQVLINLALNSRDAMPEGGTITFTTANVLPDPTDLTLPPGRYVSLQVTDTGVGMPPDVAERAFEPFFTTKADPSGAGLGLATVFGIVTQAGGSVAIDSQPDAGTSVTVWLPAAEVTPAEDGDEDSERSRSPAVRVAKGVLVLDDEPELRALIERMLRHAGYEVISAGSGEEALRIAEQHEGHIDLLLTDVTMPGMSGNRVAARLRERWPRVRVLFMSGYGRPTLTAQAAIPPEAALLEKPFTRATLLRKVAETIDEDG